MEDGKLWKNNPFLPNQTIMKAAADVVWPCLVANIELPLYTGTLGVAALAPEFLPSGFKPTGMTLLIHKCFQHDVRASKGVQRWIPQTPFPLIILPPPPPISTLFLSFSWGKWLMCTLPLVVFLIASTPDAVSAMCTHVHVHAHMHTRTQAYVCENALKKPIQYTHRNLNKRFLAHTNATPYICYI